MGQIRPGEQITITITTEQGEMLVFNGISQKSSQTIEVEEKTSFNFHKTVLNKAAKTLNSKQ